jgi:hypothetical protein
MEILMPASHFQKRASEDNEVLCAKFEHGVTLPNHSAFHYLTCLFLSILYFDATCNNANIDFPIPENEIGRKVPKN